MARNYGRLVQQLRAERSALEREVERLTQAISALEGSGGRGRRSRNAGARKSAAGGRRPRRKMSAANRRAVSLRMKKYWAARRKQSE
jgi:hypothetical protein